MSDLPPADLAVPAAAPARAMHFRRRSNAPLLPRDAVRRQGAITTLAFQLLGREQAIAFLNTDHAALGGRPLALATDSVAGLQSVERLLRAGGKQD